MQASLASPRTLIGMAVASLVLGVSGPFETMSQFDLPGRLLYWLVIVVPSYVGSRAVARVTLDLLAGRIAALPQRILIATLAASIPSWLVAYGVVLATSGGTPAPPQRIWFYCLVVAGAIVVMTVMVKRTATSPGETPPAPPPVLDRVPHPQRGKLLHLSVSDHYVDVVTDRGHALVLMRLSDAIRETGAVPGLQIHRAHWVALDAVRQVHRGNGKVALELSNGTRLPVSRSFMPAARQAGLVV